MRSIKRWKISSRNCDGIPNHCNPIWMTMTTTSMMHPWWIGMNIRMICHPMTGTVVIRPECRFISSYMNVTHKHSLTCQPPQSNIQHWTCIHLRAKNVERKSLSPGETVPKERRKQRSNEWLPLETLLGTLPLLMLLYRDSMSVLELDRLDQSWIQMLMTTW